ncbi:MAG: pyrroline-5-carboxylate reductase [Thiovulaceae bacterium]|nr:pyrroline-5-carboxylate reductase [Sulfurimonadaceae bacterium]
MILTLVGTGNMSKALALGLKENYKLEIVGRTLKKAEAFIQENNLTADAFALEQLDISDKNILFCVKPYALEPVAKEFQGTARTLYSILAGTSIESLHQHIRANHIVRAMPNVAASNQASMTTLTGDETLKEQAIEIFDAIGSTLWLDSEKQLDIATGLAGSGPAYLCLVAEALADGAVRQGLKREDATKLTSGLFDGFATLLQKEHPALIKDSVMSPGGTTAAGYGALEAKAVRSAFIDAIEEAYKKTL